MSDPYFSNVTLLALNDNAANNATTFIDQSSSAKTITRHGSAIYDNTSPPSGMTTTGKFVIANPDWLSAADDVSLQMAGSDFTIEAFIKADHDGDQSFLIAKHDSGSYGPFNIFRNASNTISFYASSTGSSWDIINAFSLGSLAVADGWKHIAVSRVGNTWYGFVGGVQATTAFTSSASMLDTGKTFTIGSDNNGALAPFTGHICSVRVTKGVGRYNANFTPPTLPFELGGTTLGFGKISSNRKYFLPSEAALVLAALESKRRLSRRRFFQWLPGALWRK